MRFVSVIGLFFLLGVAWLLSNNKSKIRPRVIIWGVSLQLLFALIILSKNILSFVGLFLFLCLIILYLFRERLQQEKSVLGRTIHGLLVVLAAAGSSGAGYFLDKKVGAGMAIWVLLLVALFWGARMKKYQLNRYLATAFVGIGLGILMARNLYGQVIMKSASEKVDSFLRLTDLGTRFMFGNLVKQEYFNQFGFQFALSVLPTIIFFAAFMSILYYYGIIQAVVEGMAKFMRWTIGTSGAETLSCSSNVFVGQTEAPLLIKPFLDDLTLSELATVMVGGFATIAGGVLAGYIRMGISPAHLIAASVMSAPAALVVGKIIFPETEHSKTAGDVKIPEVQTAGNLLEAASNGITDGLKLAVNVGAMLIGFIALIGLIDVILNFLDSIIDGSILGGAYKAIDAGAFSPVKGEFSGIFPGSLKTLFGNVFRYVAFIMGTPWKDSMTVGNLLGLKIGVNEFVAYSALGQEIAHHAISPRAEIISTYALCGFANFASIGIQIGGIGALAPKRRSDLAKVGLKAMIGGAIASWMTATIAGMLL